jgi:crotonobetainyl-CoA:carnitine CoA-transferase CaiB-like acyl-CoA transferase
VIANQYLAAHPDHDRARLASGPCQFDDTPLVVRRGAPTIGQHTDEILAEAGLTTDEITHLHQTGAVA